MRELKEEEQKQFEEKFNELKEDFPQIKESEARRIFFGSWSMEYFEERCQLIEDFEEKTRSFPQELIDSKTSITVIHQNRETQGILTAWNKFDLTLQTEEGEKKLKKLDCRYFFKTEDSENAYQGIRRERKTIPFDKRSEYKWIGDDFLLKFNANYREPIILKTHEGESFLGKVQSFDKYDVVFKLNTGIDVFIFRHSIFKFCKWTTFREKQKQKQMRKRRGPMRPHGRGGRPPHAGGRRFSPGRGGQERGPRDSRNYSHSGAPRGPQEGGYRPGGGYRDNRQDGGGYRDNRQGGGYRDNRQGGGYRDNRQGGGYRDNRQGGGYRDNRQDGGGYRDNRQGGGYRQDGGYRQGGGYRDNRQDGGGYRDNRQGGGYRDNRQGGGYRDNRQDGGGYRDNRQGGGYRDNRQGGGYRDNRQDGGYRDNRQGGGYRDNRQGGGYRDNRQGGGYRDNRQGGGYRDNRGYRNEDRQGMQSRDYSPQREPSSDKKSSREEENPS